MKIGAYESKAIINLRGGSTKKFHKTMEIVIRTGRCRLYGIHRVIQMSGKGLVNKDKILNPILYTCGRFKHASEGSKSTFTVDIGSQCEL